MDINTATAPVSDERPLLTLDEVASRLRVSPWTVRGYIREGHLPKVGNMGRVRIRPADLDAFLSNTNFVSR